MYYIFPRTVLAPFHVEFSVMFVLLINLIGTEIGIDAFKYYVFLNKLRVTGTAKKYQNIG